MLNAGHALLRFRRLGRRPLGCLCVPCRPWFLGLGSDNRILGERERERSIRSEKEKSKELTLASPSAGSSIAFFFVAFFVEVAAEDLVWRVELRVARVDVFTVSVSCSSPRFLSYNTQDAAHLDHESIPWTP